MFTVSYPTDIQVSYKNVKTINVHIKFGKIACRWQVWLMDHCNLQIVTLIKKYIGE